MAAHFKGEKVHHKYLDRGADAAEERDRDDHGADVLARELRILGWMKAVIDDPRDKATLDLMLEHDEQGVPVSELAAREKTTPNALSLRFFKLRQKYAPKLAIMDDEPKRRAVLLLLLLLGIGGAVAVVAWWLRGPQVAEPRRLRPPVPVVEPAPAPKPTFDQALPTQPTAPPPPPAPPQPVPRLKP